MTRFKICCMQSAAEVELAVRHGAHAVGLVADMPSGAGILGDDRLREVGPHVPPGVEVFLLTREHELDAILRQQVDACATAIQLVDRTEPALLAELRSRLPAISLVQVLHVEGESALDEARELEPWVDALLLDSGRPSAALPELGGTGRTHDWSVSARIVAAVRKPVYLAGGLDPTNVEDAIRAVRPFGVDVCSGLRPAGALDERLLSRFVAAVQRADATTG
jgi:phosphoribosylanthranilate isomerase